MKMQVLEKRLIVGMLILLIYISSIFPTIIAMGSDSKILNEEIQDVEVTDIRFEFRKIIATIENSGTEEITTNVTFWVHYPPIITPIVVGKYTVTITDKSSVEQVHPFTCVGLHSFYVSLNDTFFNEGYHTNGFWLFLFGIEIGQRKFL